MNERRPYRCKNRKCGVEHPGGDEGAIPPGWIAVREYPGNREDRVRTVGFFCGLWCSIAGLQQIAQAERV